MSGLPYMGGEENDYIELEKLISGVEADIKDIYRIVERAKKEVYQKIRDKCGVSNYSIAVRRGISPLTYSFT